MEGCTLVCAGGGGLIIKSCLTLATPWTVACQSPLSMGFSRKEYWSGLPCSPPGDLPYLGIKLTSLTSLAFAGKFFTTSTTRETLSRLQFSSVQLLSRVRLCDQVNRSMPGLPVHHQLPELTQTHVHRVSDAIQPSHPLLSPSPSRLTEV